MFARVTSAQIHLDKIDKFIEIYKKSVVPAAKAQKGFRGIYLFVDRSTGKGMSIGLWESEEKMIATEKNRFFQEQVTKFLTFYLQPPIREGFEVVVKA
jgi:heme-degrading monooxygenase HmoA